jgi:ribokinase
MRVAVVGHVEWCEFLRVERIPGAGEIVHTVERWEEPAGGGAVAAVQLARLNGECLFLTALGGDELGGRTRRELERLGVEVRTAPTEELQRRAVVHIDESGERAITVIGRKLVPRGASPALRWRDLERVDALFFVSGDEEALRLARRARVVVATPRELPTLKDAGVELDALVGSGEDDGERYRQGDVDPAPKLIVTTAGALGGWAQPGGPYKAAPPPGPIEDAYGCGDCFAAGLTYALAAGRTAAEAIVFAARCGAAALTGRGVYAASISLESARPM